MTSPSTETLFSIVVPTLNVAPVVQACLASIAEQSFRDFEVVLVDGGSNDQTVEVASGFKTALGNRLSVRQEKDSGDGQDHDQHDYQCDESGNRRLARSMAAFSWRRRPTSR